jgi:hypothetical protein
MGTGLAGQMSQISGNLNSSTPPPIPESFSYHIVINNSQSGPFNLQQINQLFQSGQISTESLVWKPGMSTWECLKNQQELAEVVKNIPPPLPNT